MERELIELPDELNELVDEAMSRELQALGVRASGAIVPPEKALH